MSRIRTQPCEACPYRRDVASGVWRPEEYAKLPPYDAETWQQPFAGFKCHATPEFYCHGWAVVGMSRGHEYELIALRLNPPDNDIPQPSVELWGSGQEAAQHGLRDIKHPRKKARATIRKLVQRYPRIQSDDSPA